ncbi:MAG TPA: patatin-like phospholipase family protein [Anaeromyxobacteraceae bacterium]|nr:patatin-like phospholipase family protein [Anaeromyxobacteraceae bacterium]
METSERTPKANQRILNGLHPRGDGVVTLLSVDGGGMRGIIPALVLAELEKRARHPLWKMFDLMAGTSTGGLIALGLAVPGPNGHQARYDPGDLARLYREEGPTIFARSVVHDVSTAWGLFGPKYPGRPLERVLKRFFGTFRLHEALTHVVVTSYDAASASPFFFKSYRPVEPLEDEPGVHFRGDHHMWEAARATSAAPTYFPPVSLRGHGKDGGQLCLLDGGVFANNPALCALADATYMYGIPPDRTLVVSVGTGADNLRQPYEKVKRRGLVGWALPILRTVFDGVADTVDYEAHEMAGEFHRFQFLGASTALDDASPGAITRCEEAAKSVIEEHDAELTAVARRLRSLVEGAHGRAARAAP